MVMDEPKTAAARAQPVVVAHGLNQEFGHDAPLMLDCGVGRSVAATRQNAGSAA